jgi:uncharacterized protein (TIGR04255 family)
MANRVKFCDPPIIELVLGLQFVPLSGMTSGHLGWFWKRYLGDEWVKATDAVAIIDQFESFDEKRAVGLGLQLQIAQVMVPHRLQITTAAGDRMIQVQPSRFHYNWQKKGSAYPSYRQVRKEFDNSFETFCRFLAENQVGELQVNQWEITYVDHVAKGELWTEPKDWHRVFPGLLGPTPTMDAVTFESVGGEWHFEISPQRGRLHLALQYGRVGDKAEPTLILTTTARGPVNPESGMDWGDGLTLGHDKIIQVFLQIISAQAQKVWERVEQ